MDPSRTSSHPESRVPLGGQNKWLYHEDTGEVELRANGETISPFADPEDVFADPAAYPATEGEINDISEWTTIKRPALPSRIDRDMVDVIAVTDDGLEGLESSGDRTPIARLLTESNDECESSEISVDDLRR